MKKITTTFIIGLIAAVLFANPSPEEEGYYGKELSYTVEKVEGQIIIRIDLNDEVQYEYIQVVRCNDVVGDFTTIEHLEGIEIDLLKGYNVVVDKYPLSPREDVYYKVIAEDKVGVRKTYPSVKLVGNYIPL